jgi:hypothetical protein
MTTITDRAFVRTLHLEFARRRVVGRRAREFLATCHVEVDLPHIRIINNDAGTLWVPMEFTFYQGMGVTSLKVHPFNDAILECARDPGRHAQLSDCILRFLRRHGLAQAREENRMTTRERVEQLLSDPVYWESVRRRALGGALPPEIEVMLWEVTFGPPDGAAIPVGAELRRVGVKGPAVQRTASLALVNREETGVKGRDKANP